MRITQAAGEALYKFAFALQKPTLSGWHKVEEVHDVVEPSLEPETWAEQALHMRDHYFALFIDDNRFSDDGLFDGATAVHFMTDVRKQRNGLLGCDSDWISLADMQALLPDGVGAQAVAPAHEDAGPCVEADVWMEDSYMWEYLKSGGEITCGSVRSKGESPKTAKGHFFDSDSGCDSSDSYFEKSPLEALYDKRAELERGRWAWH